MIRVLRIKSIGQLQCLFMVSCFLLSITACLLRKDSSYKQIYGMEVVEICGVRSSKLVDIKSSIDVPSTNGNGLTTAACDTLLRQPFKSRIR